MIGTADVEDPKSHRRHGQARRPQASSGSLHGMAIEAMDQGVVAYGADLRVALVNRRARALLHPAGDILHVGTPFAQLHEALTACGDLAHLARSVRTHLADNRLDLLPRSFEWQRGSGLTLDVRQGRLPCGGFVFTLTEITQRAQVEEKIRHMATHDALTGLPNRVLFRKRLDDALAVPGRVAVLVCDLDRFKAVNDTYGHPVGDLLLGLVAERMRAILRPGDTVARLGGDEFAVVLSPVAGEECVEAVALRLIAAVNEPVAIDGHRIEVGLSVGSVVACRPACTPDELFKCADIALYEAKAGGRNAHCTFEPSTGARVATQGHLALAMKEALRRNEFHLAYQPVIETATGRIVSFEALMRWTHPVNGVIAPTQFIPVAEETGQIVPLGEWALREACREAAAWPPSIRIGVNVSAMQLRRPAFEAEVMSALQASGLAPERLKLEVTESVLIQDAEAVLARLHRLRAVGIKIALDDFGTGYSSLSYLRRFPFDKIKLDRAFIRDITEPDAAAIVRAVVGIGERLGMTVVAEGVETPEQLELVRREGCSEVQGYIFSRPLAPEDARAFIGQYPLLHLVA